MNTNQDRLLVKIRAAWTVSPGLSFGYFLESVENLAWDMVNERFYSTRLMNLPDNILEAALDQWVSSPAVRVRWTVKGQ